MPSFRFRFAVRGDDSGLAQSAHCLLSGEMLKESLDFPNIVTKLILLTELIAEFMRVIKHDQARYEIK